MAINRHTSNFGITLQHVRRLLCLDWKRLPYDTTMLSNLLEVTGVSFYMEDKLIRLLSV